MKSTRLHNTQALIDFILGICDANGLKPATRMGAGMSVYLMSVIQQAEVENIEVAHRNLDRQITLLQALRACADSEAMEVVAEAATQESVRKYANQPEPTMKP